MKLKHNPPAEKDPFYQKNTAISKFCEKIQNENGIKKNLILYVKHDLMHMDEVGLISKNNLLAT